MGREFAKQLESSKCFLWEVAFELNLKGHQGVYQERYYREMQRGVRKWYVW